MLLKNISKNIKKHQIKNEDMWELLFYLVITFCLVKLIQYVIKNRKTIEHFIILEKYKIPSITQNDNIKIPKKIWQTHESNDLPESSYKHINRLIKLNPDYQYRFFTDSDMELYIKNNFENNVLKAYKKIKPGAGKADIWRLSVIYKEGGIYLDVDKILKENGIPFNKIIKPDDKFIQGRNWYIWGYDAPSTNAILCAVPNHPIIKEAFYSVIDSVNNNKPIEQIDKHKGWAKLENYTGTPHLWKAISNNIGMINLKEGEYSNGVIISNKLEDNFQQNKDYGGDLKKMGISHWTSQPVFNDKINENLTNLKNENKNSKNIKIALCMWYDDNIKEYADITYKINKLYCNNHNIELIKSSNRQIANRKPHWERLPLLINTINTNKYDYVIWLDADACLNLECEYDLYDLIEKYKDKDIIFSGDINIQHEYQINSGVIILKNSNYSKKILDYWMTEECFKNKIDGFNDQGCLRYSLKINYENLNNNSVIIPYGDLQKFSIEKENKKILFFHLAGYNKKYRIQQFSNLYNNYLNKFIKNKISVLILHYKRPHNLEKIINELSTYDIIDDIVILHGHKDYVKNIINKKVKNIDDFDDNNKYYTMKKFKNVFHCKNENILLLDDDLYPSKELLDNMYKNYLNDKENIYGPTKRLCDKNGYNWGVNKHNYILTGLILTSKKIVISTFENMKKNKEFYDLVLQYKGNCEDLLFNYTFIKHYNKNPYFVDGKVIELDKSNGFSSSNEHLNLRNNFCKKLYH